MDITIVLSTKAHDHLGTLCNVPQNSISFNKNLNSANELSFEVYYRLDDTIEPLWEQIISINTIYVPEFDEYYQIDVQLDEDAQQKKTVTATSACVVELSNSMLYNIEINNENDKLWLEDDANNASEYRYTVFYEDDPEKKNQSLLHRILEKVPQYSIAHVDQSLKRLQRSFSLDNVSIYDALTGDIAEQFNCIFEFNSVDRTISVYDLYTVCETIVDQVGTDYITCGYRGPYEAFCNTETGVCKCPKCGSTGIALKLKFFGDETPTYIDSENLADGAITFNVDSDQIKNCFKFEAGDDTMTSAAISCNPSGSDYIYYFNPYALLDMPLELRNKLSEYNNEYEYYKNEKVFSANDDSHPDLVLLNNLVEYNNLLNKAITYDSQDDPKTYSELYYALTNRTLSPANYAIDESTGEYYYYVTGYSGLSKLLYDLTDFVLFLQNSMMPSVDVRFVNATDEAQKLFNGEIYSSITCKLYKSAVENLTTGTSSQTVESVIKNLVKVYTLSSYIKIDIETIEWDTSTITPIDNTDYEKCMWSGYLQITSNSDEDDTVFIYDGGITTERNTAINSPLIIEVNNDYETFVRQKLSKKLTEDTNDKNTYDVLNMDISDEDEEIEAGKIAIFKNTLKKYSQSRLQSFLNSIDQCRTVLTSAGQSEEDSELYDIYTDYNEKYAYINSELTERTSEILSLYDDDLSNKSPCYNTVYTIIKDVQDKFNLKEYIGDELYSIFCLYKREDKYSNQNYISDGLNNADLLSRAQEFLDKANEELKIAGTPQYTISTSLYNIFNIDDFKSIRNNFKLGNWLRIKVNNEIYRLRLISYGGNASDESTINVTFSDVTTAPGVANDIASILSSAQSIASSYNYVQKQATEGENAKNKIDSVLKDGLDSALVNLYQGNRKTMEFTERGLLGRDYDDIEEAYSNEQMLLTNNMLVFTDDNWQTAQLGLGKHNYYYMHEYESGNIELLQDIGYGLSARFVTAGVVYGSQIISGDIYSNNYSYDIDTDTTTGTHFDLETGSFSMADGKITYNSEEGLLELKDVSIELSDDYVRTEVYNEDKEFFNSYIYLNPNGAEITLTTSDAESGNVLTLSETPEGLHFIINNITKAELTNQYLSITDAYISNALYFNPKSNNLGKLAFIPRQNGNLSLRLEE